MKPRPAAGEGADGTKTSGLSPGSARSGRCTIAASRVHSQHECARRDDAEAPSSSTRIARRAPSRGSTRVRGRARQREQHVAALVEDKREDAEQDQHPDHVARATDDAEDAGTPGRAQPRARPWRRRAREVEAEPPDEGREGDGCERQQDRGRLGPVGPARPKSAPAPAARRAGDAAACDPTRSASPASTATIAARFRQKLRARSSGAAATVSQRTRTARRRAAGSAPRPAAGRRCAAHRRSSRRHRQARASRRRAPRQAKVDCKEARQRVRAQSSGHGAGPAAGQEQRAVERHEERRVGQHVGGGRVPAKRQHLAPVAHGRLHGRRRVQPSRSSMPNPDGSRSDCCSPKSNSATTRPPPASQLTGTMAPEARAPPSPRRDAVVSNRRPHRRPRPPPCPQARPRGQRLRPSRLPRLRPPPHWSGSVRRRAKNRVHHRDERARRNT